MSFFRSQHWSTRAALIVGGGAIATAALLMTTGARQPSAAAPPPAGNEVSMISADGFGAMERARTLASQRDFNGANAVLVEALRDIAPSGELTDYFFLRNAELKTRAWSGDVEGAVKGYIEWLGKTPTEVLANEVVNTVIVGLHRHELLDEAARAAAAQPAAAARIAVARLEVAVERGEYDALLESAALDEAGRLAGAGDLSRQLLFGLMGSVANRADAPSPARVAESVAAVVDPSLHDANFLLNWAAEEERLGHYAAAAKVLAAAEPILRTATDDIRWNWSQANIAFGEQRLYEARQYSDVVKALAATKEIEMNFAFAREAAILDKLIDRADINSGGHGMSNLTAQPAPVIAVPCDDVAVDEPVPADPVVDAPVETATP